jgi:outer membrane immunogenic protein
MHGGFHGYFPATVGKLPRNHDTVCHGNRRRAGYCHIATRLDSPLKAQDNYSSLRNLHGDNQNQLRIGAGILFRGVGKIMFESLLFTSQLREID